LDFELPEQAAKIAVVCQLLHAMTLRVEIDFSLPLEMTTNKSNRKSTRKVVSDCVRSSNPKSKIENPKCF